MKKLVSVIFLFAIMSLAACSGQEKGELTRVDVQKVNAEGNYEEVVMITDATSVDQLNETFRQIKWEDKKEVDMARKPDAKATLFYTFDENMPERLVDYDIWFNEKVGTATITSNNEGQSYGQLDKDNTNTLRKFYSLTNESEQLDKLNSFR